jgi:hypothetical protein
LKDYPKNKKKMLEQACPELASGFSMMRVNLSDKLYTKKGR